MEYSIRYDLKASEVFLHTMRSNYRSFIGIINIVFTLAMWVLAIRVLAEWNPWLQAILIIACIWFPVIQPLAIYGKSVKDLESLPEDMVIRFRHYDIQVIGGGKAETLHYDKIRALHERDRLVVMSDAAHGYIITDRMLGDKKEAFTAFLEERLGRAIKTAK